jgi:hypothetical protein
MPVFEGMTILIQARVSEDITRPQVGTGLRLRTMGVPFSILLAMRGSGFDSGGD